MLILPGPASFRFTCYYYRKAYYRAFAFDPPACAVGEARGTGYKGERKLLLFQNLHRYAMYVAVIFLVILWKDAIEGFFWKDGFHLGVGRAGDGDQLRAPRAYTFGCHSFRHLVGGGINSYSTTPGGRRGYAFWKKVTVLNEQHQLFAW